MKKINKYIAFAASNFEGSHSVRLLEKYIFH